MPDTTVTAYTDEDMGRFKTKQVYVLVRDDHEYILAVGSISKELVDDVKARGAGAHVIASLLADQVKATAYAKALELLR